MISAFDPATHGFVLLRDHRPPGGVRCYEFRNHASVDGISDYRRLNLYLTQDGKFVTIWWGFLEAIVAEALLREAGAEAASYDEPFFRGYIESDEQATHILRAVHPAASPPQILRRDPVKGITCDDLEPPQS